ncbi:MAG: CapA family protein [Geminicoccaceae bacterium]
MDRWHAETFDGNPASLGADTRKQNRLSILFAGDTSFGENYQDIRERRGVENILKSRGYSHSFVNFSSMLNEADLTIANLETPITDIETSPFEGKKEYIHWSDVEQAPEQLAQHKICALSLANNHAYDFGAEGLQQTLRVLGNQGLLCFGAGHDDRTAAEPLHVRADIGGRQVRIAVFGAYRAPPGAMRKFDLAAQTDKVGLAVLDPRRIGEQIRILRAEDPKLLAIAFPHWGSNYAWRTDRQSQLADQLLDAGIDLILGHGAHMLQEIEQRHRRWVVFGLGNFVFNAPGRYKKLDAPPFSFVANLIIASGDDGLSISVRLYPIVTDNRKTRYQTRFVTSGEYRRVLYLLAAQREWQNLERLRSGNDDTGAYLELPIDIL